MIPIRDTVPSKHYPIVNNTLIGINIVIFLVQIFQGTDLGLFIYFYSLIPAHYTVPGFSPDVSQGHKLFAFISFMFLHGGWMHLIGNMWSLYIFGDNVEDQLGSMRYLVFYILCGLASGLFHLIFNFHSTVPTIGASGAIAGVMGAYFILYPHSKILTLIPIIFIPLFLEIPAFIFLGIWLVLQLLNAAGSSAGASGIAWWAHIGGFIFGIVFLKMFSAFPEHGFTERTRKVTQRKKTPRLQVIRPVGPGSDPHLYGTIQISPYESLTGSRKFVNIPWGFQKRMYQISVPPGTGEGKMLRLKGMGKLMPDGQRGDTFLKVVIES